MIQGGTATELPEEVVAAYEAPFPNAESKAGAGPVPAPGPDLEDVRWSPTAMRRGRRGALALGEAGAVAFSDSDPVFPYPKAGERFTELIPTAGEQVKIEGAAHFLQEDRARQIAAEILTFLG